VASAAKIAGADNVGPDGKLRGMTNHPSASPVYFPTRRNVLRAAGGGLLAASLAPAMSFAQAPAPAGKKLGIALVGIGKLTMGQLLPAFAKCKNIAPVALVSGSPDKAKEQAAKYGIDTKNIYNYENYDSIKDNPAIDAVYVVLPNAMHAEYTMRAAKAGKHVLCEKPMEVSSAKCREMIEVCKSNGKKLMVAYRLRYEPNNMALIDTVEKKVCGDLKIIEASAGFMIGKPHDQWRLRSPLAGGGCLMDIGVYALNAARYISREEPVEVNAFTHRTETDPRFVDPACEESCNFQLRFPSGVLANCTSSYGTGLNRYRAHCSSGWAEVEPALSYQGVKFRYDARKGKQEPNVGEVDHFAAEMDHFADCVINNKEIRTPGEEGLKDLLVIEAIYEAAKTGQTVKVKPV
jgi:predicted dehydrogenase